MKKTISIMAIVILGMGYLLLSLYSSKQKLKEDMDILKKNTKVVIKQKNIEVPKPYKVYVSPEKEIQYLPDTSKNKYDSLKLAYNHLVLLSHNQTNKLVHDTLIISNSFLLQFPQASKLISFDLTKSKLNLQLLRIDGIPVEDQYKLDLDNYNYKYVDGRMTTKRFGNFHIYPDINYSYRVLHNLHDLDLGLNVKTTNFNYRVAGNSYYYPSFNQTGYDLKLSVQYNF